MHNYNGVNSIVYFSSTNILCSISKLKEYYYNFFLE